MSQPIESAALGFTNPSIGVTGATRGDTLLDDGRVVQNLSVISSARRGMSPVPGGTFSGQVLHEHAGAGDLNNTFDPYNIGTTFVKPPFPAAVSNRFDLWLLNVSMARRSGAADGSAVVMLAADAAGFGIDDTGGTINIDQATVVAAFEGIDVIGSTTRFLVLGTGQFLAPVNLRLTRNPRIGAGSIGAITIRSTADGAMDIDFILNFGMFPVTLGQDAGF